MQSIRMLEYQSIECELIQIIKQIEKEGKK